MAGPVLPDGFHVAASLVLTVAAAAFRVGLDVAASLKPALAAEAIGERKGVTPSSFISLALSSISRDKSTVSRLLFGASRALWRRHGYKVSVGLRHCGCHFVWEVSVGLRHRVSQLV